MPLRNYLLHGRVLPLQRAERRWMESVRRNPAAGMDKARIDETSVVAADVGADWSACGGLPDGQNDHCAIEYAANHSLNELLTRALDETAVGYRRGSFPQTR